MKNIRFYPAQKYSDGTYVEVRPGIYVRDGEGYCSLVFVQEPEFGESDTPAVISQYPLEDILDNYGIYVNDLYDEINAASEVDTHIEFGGGVEDLVNVAAYVGKHVYVREDDTGATLVEE